LNSENQNQPFSFRRTVFSAALATGILSALPGCGLLCSCFFGMAGILGGWFGLWLFYRSGGRAPAGKAAWLGLYGAVLGTLAAMAVLLLMGQFSPTHENLQAMMDQFREYLSKEGKSPQEVEKELKALWPAVVSGIRWMPLVLVVTNGLGGAGGGALASLFAEARRARRDREGGPPQDSSGASSSRMEQ